MNETTLRDDQKFRNLVRDAERLTRNAVPYGQAKKTIDFSQNTKTSVDTFNNLKKQYMELHIELKTLAEKEQTPDVTVLEKKLINLESNIGKELGFTQVEFRFLVDDLSKRSAELIETHKELSLETDEKRNSLLASAAKPILLTTMNVSPFAYIAPETLEDALAGDVGTCQGVCTASYIAEEAVATAVYVGASASCVALVAVPFVGAALALTCAGAAAAAYAATYAALSITYVDCWAKCEE